jgi:hypothetical protein
MKHGDQVTILPSAPVESRHHGRIGLISGKAKTPKGSKQVYKLHCQGAVLEISADHLQEAGTW